MAKKLAMGSPMGQIIGGRGLASSTTLLLFCCCIVLFVPAQKFTLLLGRPLHLQKVTRHVGGFGWRGMFRAVLSGLRQVAWRSGPVLTICV
jgi:hypothetical protein